MVATLPNPDQTDDAQRSVVKETRSPVIVIGRLGYQGLLLSAAVANSAVVFH